MHVTAETLRALRDKYRTIKRMRDENDRGVAGDPQREMAELARRFPGALRELDELPPGDDRAASRGARSGLRSARAASRSGSRCRSAITACCGRSCASNGCRPGAAARMRQRFLRELAQGYAPAVDEPELGGFDHAALCAILEPPGGQAESVGLRPRGGAARGLTGDRASSPVRTLKLRAFCIRGRHHAPENIAALGGNHGVLCLLRTRLQA